MIFDGKSSQEYPSNAVLARGSWKSIHQLFYFSRKENQWLKQNQKKMAGNKPTNQTDTKQS